MLTQLRKPTCVTTDSEVQWRTGFNCCNTLCSGDATAKNRRLATILYATNSNKKTNQRQNNGSAHTLRRNSRMLVIPFPITSGGGHSNGFPSSPKNSSANTRWAENRKRKERPHSPCGAHQTNAECWQPNTYMRGHTYRWAGL